MADWRNLPAGLELDALVAERVLGWTNCHVALSNVRGIPPEFVDRQPPDRTVNFPGRAWSRVISSAWEVVEAMERQGWRLELGHYRAHYRDSERTPGIWRASFWSTVGASEGYATRKAKTAPLAICRAALAAMETEA